MTTYEDVYSYIKNQSTETKESLEEKVCDGLIKEDISLYQMATNIAAWLSYDFLCFEKLGDSDASPSKGAFESQALNLLGYYLNRILQSNLDVGVASLFAFIKKTHSLTEQELSTAYSYDKFQQVMQAVARKLYRYEKSSNESRPISWRDIDPSLSERLHPTYRYMLDTWSRCISDDRPNGTQDIYFIFNNKEAYEGVNWAKMLGEKNFYFVYDPSRKAKLDALFSKEQVQDQERITYLDKEAGTSSIIYAKKLISTYFPHAIFSMIGS
jgi:hypothetical protein